MTSTALHHGRFRVTRIQANVVARRERLLLTWLCARLPSWIMPDHLTLIGLLGAVVCFASYVASRFNPAFLSLASFGLVVHWFGDSLDGSLARHRAIERPIYGYLLDHTVDAVSNLLIMGGIGLSLYVRMDVALFALTGYYLLCIYVFINNHLFSVLRLSFLGGGPTELRLGLIAINIGMALAGPVGIVVAGQTFSIYDAVLFLAGTIFTSIFVVRIAIDLRELRDPAQSASRNFSRAAK